MNNHNRNRSSRYPSPKQPDYNDEMRRLYLNSKHRPTNASTAISNLTKELPFVGIMLYGFKHSK